MPLNDRIAAEMEYAPHSSGYEYLFASAIQ
jgi:hypothetical protein